jgi:hypothetical protein
MKAMAERPRPIQQGEKVTERPEQRPDFLRFHLDHSLQPEMDSRGPGFGEFIHEDRPPHADRSLSKYIVATEYFTYFAVILGSHSGTASGSGR